MESSTNFNIGDAIEITSDFGMPNWFWEGRSGVISEKDFTGYQALVEWDIKVPDWPHPDSNSSNIPYKDMKLKNSLEDWFEYTEGE